MHVYSQLLTCLYDVQLQRHITPWEVTLNGTTPISESDSEQKNTLIVNEVS